MHSKAYRIYNKHTKSIEESIHVIFDESNNGALSGSIVQNLSLNKHSGDEEETPKKVNPGNKQLLKVPLNTDPRDDTLSEEEEKPTNEEISTPEAPRHEVTQRNFKYNSYHPMDNLLTDISTGVRTRLSLYNFYAFFSFVSHIGLRNHLKALSVSNWINAMQEELNQFEQN